MPQRSLGEFPLLSGKAVWEGWWKKPHFSYSKKAIPDTTFRSSHCTEPQKSCLLHVGVPTFKQIFGKQTIYNLGTDLTLATPNFQTENPLITCVIQVDTIGDNIHYNVSGLQ